MIRRYLFLSLISIKIDSYEVKVVLYGYKGSVVCETNYDEMSEMYLA